MKIKRIIGVVLALCLVLPIGVLASDFSNIVAFGDSLSDNGNIFNIDPAACPAEKYYQGRFSNGLVWVDYLAQADYLNATLINKAYGGAWTSGDNPPGLIEQVTAFINASTLPPNALFTIWIGGNDFLDGSSDFNKSADNVKTALDALATFGVESILILNLPDLGAIPLNNGDPQKSAVATVLTEGYNNALKDNVDDFKTENPAITVYYMDIYALFQDFSANPGKYGLSNVDSICPNFLVDDEFDNDDGHLFWDAIHPTTEVHEELAVRAKALVAPAADPDSGSGATGGCFVTSMAMAK
jgi:phospholipase/lecithinase/hemolysin